jgi:hypothetical protein
MIFLKIVEHQQLPVYFQQAYFFHVIVMQSIDQEEKAEGNKILRDRKSTIPLPSLMFEE